MFTVLLVGYGKIAGRYDANSLHTHYGAILSTPNLKLVGIVDFIPPPSTLSLHVQYFSSLEVALCTLNPDIITISTPDHTHVDVIYQIFNNSLSTPKLIFVEKPLCHKISEFAKIKNLSERASVPVIINHSRRFSSLYKRLRSLILSGSLGSPVHIQAFYYSGWHHNGIHIVDILLYLFNQRISWSTLHSSIASPYPDDPTLNISGYFESSGTTINLSSISESHYQVFDIDLFFSTSRIQVRNFESSLVFEEKEMNACGESVLSPRSFFVYDHMEPMLSAYSLISLYLQSFDSSLLLDCSLDAFEPTLTCLENGFSLLNHHH
jgi:predicted dehydrogenase